MSETPQSPVDPSLVPSLDPSQAGSAYTDESAIGNSPTRIWKQLESTRDATHAFMKERMDKVQIRSWQNANAFSNGILHMFKIIMKEKEIIFFAILQWLCIMGGYMLFIQMLDWIPDSLWNAIGDDKNGAKLVNIALLVWGMFVVILVAFPLGILNSAIVAVHLQYKIYGTSYMFKALDMALRNIWRVWSFTAVDAWITCDAILGRLPKKNNDRTAVDEMLYYAWKLATFSMVPALLNGRGFIAAGSENFNMIKQSPGTVMGFRFGYSLFCWIVGIAAYIGSIYWYCVNGGSSAHGGPNFIYVFYRLMVVPLVIAVGIVSVVLRPFYLLCVSEVYSRHVTIDVDYIEGKRDIVVLRWALFVFCILGAAVMTLAFLPEETGIRAYIESLAAKDMVTMK